MAFTTEYRPMRIAVQVALAGHISQSGRLCRVVVFFPDIGNLPVTEKLGFVPWANSQGDRKGAVTPVRSNHQS